MKNKARVPKEALKIVTRIATLLVLAGLALSCESSPYPERTANTVRKAQEFSANRPNIVLINADDLG